MLFENFVQIMS